MSDPLLSNDIEAVLRAYILTVPDLTDEIVTQATKRIWAGADPPEGFRPTPDPSDPRTGSGILIQIANPGDVLNGIIARPVVRFRSYGRDAKTARELNQKLHTALEGRGFRTVRRIWLTGVPRPDVEPDKGWNYVDADYRVIAVIASQ